MEVSINQESVLIPPASSFCNMCTSPAELLWCGVIQLPQMEFIPVPRNGVMDGAIASRFFCAKVRGHDVHAHLALATVVRRP